MQILVCIDDTDDLESKGTGELAGEIAAKIEADGWGHTFGITRHQLFVHPDIPYTSHNSAMCFKAEIEGKYLPHIIDYASRYLLEQSAPSADPGLCVANIASLRSPDGLIEFGLRAKKDIITKEEAYQTAKFQGIHLSEHGGTGQGVVGALAGAGLRLSGNDGRYKGKIKLSGAPGAMTVKELLDCTSIDGVQSLAGDLLDPGEAIDVDSEIKTVHLGHKRVLLVSRSAAQDKTRWVLCSKQQLKAF